MRRVLALLLLLCTLFLLCACPGGGPVEPPVGGDVCDICGKDPCECPTGEVCPDCGKNPCECPEKPAGNGVTVTPDEADYSIVFGAGATIDGTGDSLA
ncbi:MAG: hypothetical protein IJ009_02160, partial [Clostridia bacterium]|nr:hypothetical protein [Clostridia bacterium]